MISTKLTSNVKLLIALAALISTTDAQKQSQPKNSISCTSNSPECCWVWKIREIWGLSVADSSKKGTKNTQDFCQSSIGITCSGQKVTEFRVVSQGITGSIPDDIKNLKSLQVL